MTTRRADLGCCDDRLALGGDGPVIVLDGRNDREKLNELLADGEQTHLDYKETLDLAQGKDKLHIVKDLVSLSNRPGGGYLVIGADDTGTPVVPIGTLDRQKFDGANLGQLVRGYIDGQIHLNSQVYELDGNEVIVIQVGGHSDGLPVPLSKIGQYHDAIRGKDVVVFREGEVVLREGPANVTLAHRHWQELLAEHDRQIKASAMEDSQALIAEVVKQFGQGGSGPTTPPLALGMSAESYADAVLLTFESGSTIRTKRFLEQARQSATSPATDPETVSEALDRIAELACLAILYEREQEAQAAINKLYDIYLQRHQGGTTATSLTDILARVYAIGSLAVRLRRWAVVNHIVQKPVRSHSNSSYVFASWLRHGQVEGSRQGVFPERGLLISMARNLMSTHPGLRPDVPDEAVTAAEDLDHDDNLLNSLCQFDLAYCLITSAEGDGQARGYPTCAAFHQTRADPLFEIIASEPMVRSELFPESSNAQVAAAMVQVAAMASKESWNFGSFWSGLPSAAENFVARYGAADGS